MTRQLIFLLFVCCFPLISLAQSDQSIRIDILNKENAIIWEYNLTPRELSVTRHSTQGGLPLTVYETSLNPQQKSRADSLFSACHPDRMKEAYTDSLTQGDRSFVFHFRIADIRRQVLVYNKQPEELKSIVTICNEWLPEKYRIDF